MSFVQIPPEGGGGGAVDSVNGQTGVVVLTKSNIGLGNVDNTSDLNKPVSTATQTAVDAKANLAGGNSFTGAQSFGDGVIERFSGQVEGLPGTSKTLAATDNGKVVRTTGGANTTITIPNTLTIGFNLMVVRDGTGEVEFATSGGMNLRHPDNHDKIRLRYSAISLLVVASNECILMGDTKL